MLARNGVAVVVIKLIVVGDVTKTVAKAANLVVMETVDIVVFGKNGLGVWKRGGDRHGPARGGPSIASKRYATNEPPVRPTLYDNVIILPGKPS